MAAQSAQGLFTIFQRTVRIRKRESNLFAYVNAKCARSLSAERYQLTHALASYVFFACVYFSLIINGLFHLQRQRENKVGAWEIRWLRAKCVLVAWPFILLLHNIVAYEPMTDYEFCALFFCANCAYSIVYTERKPKISKSPNPMALTQTTGVCTMGRCRAILKSGNAVWLGCWHNSSADILTA